MDAISARMIGLLSAYRL